MSFKITLAGHKCHFFVSWNPEGMILFNTFYTTEMEHAAKLFGCTTQALINTLITRTVHSATDKVTTHLSKSDVSRAIL